MNPRDIETRRQRRWLLRTALLGSGLAGLQALATGLPRSVFTRGLGALDAHAAGSTPQYLILLTSNAGDPVNAGAPGIHGVRGVVANPQPSMAGRTIDLGPVRTSAAAPWASLPQWTLDRTAVIHHRTYQNAHNLYSKVMGLVGSARNRSGNGSEHLSSLISSELAGPLGTAQQEPIRLAMGREPLSFEGRAIQNLAPSTLADLLTPDADDAGVLELARLRDQSLDAVYRIATEYGTPRQQRLIDRLAHTRDQARELDLGLVDRFSSIDGDDTSNQLSAALTLLMMNVSPVVTVTVEWGGDNHSDPGLEEEAAGMVSGFEILREFYEELETSPLRDRVTVAYFGVFGRTLASRGTYGRDHNLNHHTMTIMGDRVSPGVYGGVTPIGEDFGATAMDSASGASVDEGDIPTTETLEAAGRTLARAVGVTDAAIDQRIQGGRVIRAAIRS